MTDDILVYPEEIGSDPYDPDLTSPGESVLERKLEELIKPLVRPKAQITLLVTAGGLTSNIFNTSVRYLIEWIIVPAAVAARFDLLVGVSKVLEGINPAAGVAFPCAIIIPGGVDVSIASSAGVAIQATNLTVWLVGEIIN